MKRTILYTLFAVLMHLMADAQILSEKGMPELRNFTPNEYGNIGKVWGIQSDGNGIIYMSSDGGLVEYDGQVWKRFKGSSGFTRSILVVNDSTIYTGSDLDFGVWRRDEWNDMLYTSLYPFKEEPFQEGEEFWQVHNLGETIVFVSFHNFYLYRNEQLTKIAAPTRFTGSYKVDEVLYFADEQEGLWRLEDISLVQVAAPTSDISLSVKGLYFKDSTLLVVTQSDGIFQLKNGQFKFLQNELSRMLKGAQVFSFEMLGESHMAFGTVQQGLFISDTNGKIFHHINKQKGLPNNTILSMHFLSAGYLWLGMDYGISSINLMDNISYLYDYMGDFGTGQTAIIQKENFYLGTNQGLYTTPWNQLSNAQPTYHFDLIPGSEGQVWCLIKIGDELIMGHDKGLYSVNGNTIKKILSCPGVWTIVPRDNKILLGTYNGIYILQKENGQWNLETKMNEILGSCNQLIFQNPNLLWVHIPNFGIVKATLDDNLQPQSRYNFSVDMFKGDHPHLYISNSEMYIKTDSFDYKYRESANQFDLIGDNTLHPKAIGQLPGHYFSDSLHRYYHFIPIFNGFALDHRKDTVDSFKSELKLLIRKLEVFDNHSLKRIAPGTMVPYNQNNITIHLATPLFDNVKLSYKSLEDAPWMSASSSNSFTLMNLPSGKQEIFIRANTEQGQEVVKSLILIVETPWHKSWMIYLVYLLVAGFFLFLVHRWKKASLEKERKMLNAKEQNALKEQAVKHQKELMQIEQDKLQQDNKALKQQLKNKTIELATNAKLHNDKIKIITTINEKFEALKRSPGKSNIKWTEIQQILISAIGEEDKTFEIQIDELHQEYFHKLKEKYPVLSQNDLRMCAYLKIGLNTKEIADLLNVQPSSAYISRSRLRKKLDLNVEDDLYNFLNNL